MKPLNSYDRKGILSEEVFVEIFEQDDAIRRAQMLLSFQDRAKELGVKGQLPSLSDTVMIDYHAHTEVHLLLLPYVAQLTMAWVVDTLPGAYQACLSGCRKAVS